MLYERVADIIAKGHKSYQRSCQEGNGKNGNNKRLGIINKQDEP